MYEVIFCAGEKKERLITYNGKTQNLLAWSRELNIPYATLKSRLNLLHWTVEKAFTYERGK